MIEQSIYFALGCIVTALAAMLFAPIFWNRALKLTRRRLQLQVPLSMQEIYAERDQLRAQFAVDRLRLEREATRVKSTKADDLAEIGRRTVEITRKEEELGRLNHQMRELRVELGQAEAHIQARALAEKEADASLTAARGRLAELRSSKQTPTEEAEPDAVPTVAWSDDTIAALDKDLADAQDHLGRAKLDLPESAVRAAEIQRIKQSLQQLDLAPSTAKGEVLGAEALAMRESIHALGLAVAAMGRPAPEAGSSSASRKQVSEQA